MNRSGRSGPPSSRRSTGRAAGSLGTLGLLCVLAAAAAGAPAGVRGLPVLTAAPAGAAVASPVPLPPSAPLSVGVATPGAAWAVVAMGVIRDPADTFWELFHRATGAARWTLVTPPGVATNGGLVLSASVDPDGAVTAGVEPTNLLEFSPLSQTADGGAHYATGLVPVGLAARPDALTGQMGARLFALVRPHGGQVLTGTGTGGPFAVVATARSLDAAAPTSCGVTTIDAVTQSASGTPLVGAGCRRGGQVGVFSPAGGGWRLTGPRLGAGAAGAPTAMLRLTETTEGAVALVAAGAGRRQALLALWQRGGTPGWRVSTPLPLAVAAQLRSPAVSPGGAVLALVAGPRRRQLVGVDGPGQAWRQWPAPPPGTSTVAAEADGSIDAFVAVRSSLRVWVLAPGARRWTVLQTTEVPVDYGSSS